MIATAELDTLIEAALSELLPEPSKYPVGTTFGVSWSYEATTLDYLSPRWLDGEGHPTFATEAEAEEEVAARYAHDREAGFPSGPIAYRVRVIYTEAERTRQYDADAEANARYWSDRAAANKAMEATTPRKGKTVTVVRGRKVAKGTTGYVIWEGEDNYGKARVGIKDEAGEVHWTAASNCQVIPADED